METRLIHGAYSYHGDAGRAFHPGIESHTAQAERAAGSGDSHIFEDFMDLELLLYQDSELFGTAMHDDLD
jgi:hypothetical protein